MFNNKKLRIAAALMVLLIGLLALAGNTVQVRENPTILEKGLRIVASPFQNGFHAISNVFDGIGIYFADKKTLEEENFKLQQELDGLQYQIMRLEETIAKKNNNLQYMITINKGGDDGVKAGMTVMNHHGLIGRVSSVLSSSSEVLLLPDHESAVGARVKSTREALGVVKGDGTSTGNLHMVHLQHDAEIAEGDVIITSGLDTVYPAMMPTV